MDKKKMVKEGYDSIASEYLSTRTEDSEDVQLLLKLIQKLPKGAKVLDAGCGAGVPVTRLLSMFFDVTGVDFAEEQIRLARELVPHARFLCKDITELTFPEQTFDAICSYYAIIHIPRQEHRQLLLDFYRMLKPSGLLLVCMGAEDIAEDIDENYCGTRMYWSMTWMQIKKSLRNVDSPSSGLGLSWIAPAPRHHIFLCLHKDLARKQIK